MTQRGFPIGAAVLFLGFSLAGPTTPGMAAADGGDSDSSEVSAGPARGTGSAVRSGRESRAARVAPRAPRVEVSGQVRSGATVRHVTAPVSASDAADPSVGQLIPDVVVTDPGAGSTRATPAGSPTGRAISTATPQTSTARDDVSPRVPRAFDTGNPPRAGATAPAGGVVDGGGLPTFEDSSAEIAAAISVPALVAASAERAVVPPGSPASLHRGPVIEQAIAGLNDAVVRLLDAVSRALSGLPAGPVADLLSGALLLVRRNLFDQAPTVTSVQRINSALQTDGDLHATDPEDDPVRIDLVAAPQFGVVELAADGGFRYLPGPEFAGSDSFTVKATDVNGGFNLLYPRREPATFYTVGIASPVPGTMLTINLRRAFLKDVTGTETGEPGAGTLHGSYVYLYQPKPADGAPNWTKLVDNGRITDAVHAPDLENLEYHADVALNAEHQTIAGGAIYLIVQSENPEPCQTGQKSNCHTDLTKVTGWEEAFVQQKVRDYNYGYTAFEYALLNQAGDQGDITYIPGFGPHVAVKVCASAGCDTRGLAMNSKDFVEGLLDAGLNPEAVFNYPTAPIGATPFSPLDGKPSIVISPSNGSFGAQYYPDSDWDEYLTKTIDKLPPDAMTFSGTTAGARDAAGIWHNGQYYSYSVRAVTDDKDGKVTNYYLFSPDANSQTQGYMLIKQADVGKNLYAPGQGSALATLYESVTVDSNGVITELGRTYDIPGRTPPGTTPPPPGQFNVSGNNQWGNALTQYFTGFTAGNWGTVANQANPANRGGPDAENLAGTVDLNSNLNWDPAYAFDEQRLPGTAPDYQHNDLYSYFFYQHANTYASAFSDNLAQKLNPGPQISLATGPGQNENVRQIDLYVFGSEEPIGLDGDGFYKKPVSTNYLAHPFGREYVIPDHPDSTLTLQVQGFNLASKVADDATVRLGIYKGKDLAQQAQFDYVTLPTQGDVYQNFTIAGAPGAWTASSAGSNPLGFIQINGLPMPSHVVKDDVYWYQLVIADATGGNQRVFDIYATAGGPTLGELQPYNPPGGIGSANSPLAAIDNNARLGVFTTYADGKFIASQITVNLQPDGSLPAALLTNGYDPNTVNKPQGPEAPGTRPVITALAAPVVGHLDGSGAFTSAAGQYGTGVTKEQGYQQIIDQASSSPGNPVYFANPLPTAHVGSGTSVAFGWTGTNSYAGQADSDGVRYAPTMPVFQTAAPFDMTQAGQVGEYTNKILPGNTARVTIKQGTTTVGTVHGVGDLDGQWQTGAITLGPGEYTATMTELTPDGSPVVDYLGRPKPESVAVTIIVDIP